MKKLLLVTIICIIGNKLEAQKSYNIYYKSSYSIITNINIEDLKYKYTSIPKIKSSFGLLMAKDLNDFELEFGLGYSNKGQVFHFNYYEPLFPWKIDKKQNISLHYLSVPIKFNKVLKNNPKSKFLISGNLSFFSYP